jgi:hypothetical protein
LLAADIHFSIPRRSKARSFFSEGKSRNKPLGSELCFPAAAESERSQTQGDAKQECFSHQISKGKGAGLNEDPHLNSLKSRNPTHKLLSFVHAGSSAGQAINSTAWQTT